MNTKITDTFKGKSIVVTGHTGFKGSWLTTWLLNMGAEVTGISDDIPTNPSLFEAAQLKDKINHYYEDVTNLEKTKEIILRHRPDFIFHLAAQAIVSTSYENPVKTFETNVIGSINIMESLRSLEKPCVAVMITSDKCYDNAEWVWGYKETDHLGGKDIYSGSKGAAELAIKSYYHSFLKCSPHKIASVRAGNVIGGGDWAKDRIIPDCIRAWNENQAVEIRSPQATRPWQHVLEPLSGYLQTAHCLNQSEIENGENYNFGPSSDLNIPVLSLIKELTQYWTFEKEYNPINVKEQQKFYEAKLLKLNCDKALFDMKWKPTLTYKETVEFVGQWYESFYHKEESMWDFTEGQIKKYTSLAQERNIFWS